MRRRAVAVGQGLSWQQNRRHQIARTGPGLRRNRLGSTTTSSVDTFFHANRSIRSLADCGVASGVKPALWAAQPTMASGVTPESRYLLKRVSPCLLANRRPSLPNTSGTWAKVGTSSPSAR